MASHYSASPVYCRVLGRKLLLNVKPQIQEEQKCFALAIEQRTISCLLEVTWEFTHPVHCVLWNWRKLVTLQKYRIWWWNSLLLWAIPSEHSESCVCILDIRSGIFSVGVALRQGYCLSLILVFMDSILRRSQSQECVRIRSLRFCWPP